MIKFSDGEIFDAKNHGGITQMMVDSLNLFLNLDSDVTIKLEKMVGEYYSNLFEYSDLLDGELDDIEIEEYNFGNANFKGVIKKLYQVENEAEAFKRSKLQSVSINVEWDEYKNNFFSVSFREFLTGPTGTITILFRNGIPISWSGGYYDDLAEFDVQI